MRYRVRWAKRGKLRYLSHHDEALVFERSARRAGLPLAYSKGFTPHPKIAFGSGLPVGYGSEVELLDLELTDALPGDEVVRLFNRGLPDGLQIHAAVPLVPGATSLGALIQGADYEIGCDPEVFGPALTRFMALDGYPMVKPYKGGYRTDDLRAGVWSAEQTATGLKMRCAIKPRAIRPSDVFRALEESIEQRATAGSFQRVRLLTIENGAVVELDENHQQLKAAS